LDTHPRPLARADVSSHFGEPLLPPDLLRTSHAASTRLQHTIRHAPITDQDAQL
jgi:hypothetical protein